MIQDIYPLKLDNAYHPQEIQAADYILIFNGQDIFIQDGDEIQYLTYAQLCAHQVLPVCIYLFSLGEKHYFWADVEEPLQIAGFHYRPMREVRAMYPKESIMVAATALHLYTWYCNNRYCGRCGSKLVHSTQMRMLECPVCRNNVFPTIAPAVIVAVTNHDKLLLTKYAAGRGVQHYALVAGFTEIGETAEETVQREVMEEVGLHVKNIRYYKTQPWGFASNLLLGYYCDLDGTASIHLDRQELAMAEWVDYRDVPKDEQKLSLTAEMMEHFRQEKIRESQQNTENE